MTENGFCETRVISDTPSEDDAFGSRSHERVAKAIEQLISSEPGGKIIGLQGGWGAGKSTVVNLLQKRVETQHGHESEIWVFDTWAHQGDPLRRTLLQSLIRRLVERKWVASDKWTGIELELARRLKVTEVENTPRLGGLGKLLLVLLFLVPVGIALFNKGLTDDKWALWSAGLLLMMSPLIALGIRYAWAFICKTIGRSPSQSSPDGSFWALFATRTLTNVRSETIETPDPTSVEFEERFTELLSDVFSDKDRRLVLVLDNLDRVDPPDARAVWSTIQTFLHHGYYRRPDWFSRLWILLPYDPDGIRRLWAGDDSPDLASAFVEKTFQVRFEVAPLVLSDWRGFLISNLKKAFPAHKDDEFHLAYRVISLARPDWSPTPRQLKILANDMGALHRQWQNEFPLSHLASYVVLRQDGARVSDRLISGEIPTPALTSLLGGELADSLAALNFNTEVPTARQLLLRGPIGKALNDGDAATLAQLASGHVEGFWEVLEGLIAAGDVLASAPSLAAAASALDASGILSAPRPEVSSIRRDLHKALKQMQEWVPLNAEVANGLLSLCAVTSPAGSDIEQMISRISASDVTSTSEDWPEAVVVLLGGLIERRLVEQPQSRIVVGANPEAWIAAATRIAQADPAGQTWMFFKPQSTSDEIGKALSTLVDAGTYLRPQADVVKLTSSLPEAQSWTPLINSIGTRLRLESPQPSSEEVAALLSSLWHLKRADAAADNLLKALATEGQILNRLYQASADNNAEALVWCLTSYLTTIPSAAAPPAIGNSQSGHQVVTDLFADPGAKPQIVAAFVDRLFELGRLALLLELFDQASNAKEFVADCFGLLIQQDRASGILDSETVITRWKSLSENLTVEDLDKLVLQLLRTGDLVTAIGERDFDPTFSGLYGSILRSREKVSKRIRSKIQMGLEHIDSDNWMSALRSRGELAALLLEFRKSESDFPLGTPFQDGLFGHAQLVLSGSVKADSISDHRNDFLDALPDHARQVFRRRLLDAACGANGAISEDFLALYGDEIADSDTLSQVADVPYRLFNPLLEKRNLAGLVWVESAIAKHPDILGAFNVAMMDDFRDRVANAAETGPQDDPALAPIKEIARLIGPPRRRSRATSKSENNPNG